MPARNISHSLNGNTKDVILVELTQDLETVTDIHCRDLTHIYWLKNSTDRTLETHFQISGVGKPQSHVKCYTQETLIIWQNECECDIAYSIICNNLKLEITQISVSKQWTDFIAFIPQNVMAPSVNTHSCIHQGRNFTDPTAKEQDQSRVWIHLDRTIQLLHAH